MIWGLTLCILSSFSHPLPDQTPGIPHLDKILHFGYFFGGGILFTLWLSFKNLQAPKTIAAYLLPICLLAVIGLLDEYRQSFTPGRSGNDFFDWLADLTGASAGTILVHQLRNPVHALLHNISRS